MKYLNHSFPTASLVSVRRFVMAGIVVVALLAAAPAIGLAADNAPAQPAAPANSPPAKPDAAAPAGAELASTIVSVEGMVQVRQADDQPWKIAKKGTKLAPGASFRTGPRARVRFTVGATQIVTLDRLGVVTVLDAIKSKGKVTTDLGMKYGRATLQVQAGGVEHESKIHSPSATLAVRGSGGGLFSDSFNSVVYCTQHEASAQIYDSKTDRMVVIQLPNQTITNTQDQDPNRTQQFADIFNPFNGGVTGPEKTLLADHPNGTYQQGMNMLGHLGQMGATQMQMQTVDTSTTGYYNGALSAYGNFYAASTDFPTTLTLAIPAFSANYSATSMGPNDTQALFLDVPNSGFGTLPAGTYQASVHNGGSGGATLQSLDIYVIDASENSSDRFILPSPLQIGPGQTKQFNFSIPSNTTMPPPS